MVRTPSMSQAMSLLEAGHPEDAAAAFEALAGPSEDGVIARFRRAECLSRLGRHDEAIADAATAHRDAPGTPATALWLAWVLAEAGRFDEAAAVQHPPGHAEFTDCVRDGFVALAKLAAGGGDGGGCAASDREDVQRTILASHHFPICSLAIRVAERGRLLGQKRWPDALSAWNAHAARTDYDETHDGPPPEPPEIRDPSLPSRSEAKAATAWLRVWGAAAYEPRTVTAVRSWKDPPDDIGVLEGEMLLAAGRIDEAQALVARIRAETKDADATAELCVLATRAEQLAGRAALPDDQPGFADAVLRAKPDVAWLRMCAAILSDRPLDARRFAEEIADPSHPEYVEAALLAWSARAPR